MGGRVYFWGGRIFKRLQCYNSVVLVVSTVAVKLPIIVSCTRLHHRLPPLHSQLIAEWEARQLIVVQGSRISASIYLHMCLYICVCVTLRNARSTSFSAQAYVLTKQMLTSSLQYQDMNCYLYH